MASSLTHPSWRRYGGVIALLAGLLLGCEPPKPVYIGVIVDASGPTASLGIAGRNGMQLAIEQANATGGIHGRPIEPLFKDDAFNPQIAQQATRELLTAKVEAILGPMTSKIAIQIMPLANEAGVLLMGGTAISPLLAGKDDQFFRTLSHKNPDALSIAQYLHQHLGLQRVSVIVEQSNQVFTEPWLSDFQGYYAAAGGSLQHTVRFTNNPQLDYAALAKQALVDQPQAVLLICSALDAALLATQLRQQRPDLPLAAASWAAADALLDMGGRAVEGLISAQAYDMHDQSAAFVAFRQAYELRFKTPIDTAAMVGYNAANVLLQALRERQPGESLKHTLLRLRKFQGVQQTVIFDDFGDVDSRVFIKVIRAGQFADAE